MNYIKLTEVINEQVAASLKWYRERSDLNPKQLSDKLGRHDLYVTQVEEGKMTLTLAELHLYALALDTHLGDVLIKAGDIQK